MTDFIICYEHMVREVENDALIKFELEKRGYSCDIMPFNGPGFVRHSVHNKARVVVAPWLRYDDNVFHYLKISGKPYKLVNLQWEQVYSQAGIESGMVATSGQAKSAIHLCWGENSKKRLMEMGVKESNLMITGAIQLDYGCSIFDSYYMSRSSIAAEFQLDPSRRWVLLISSFAYANYGDQHIKQLEKKFNYSLDELVILHKKSQTLTLDWIEQLLQLENCEFIYRPHPSENIDIRLEHMSATYSNFHVISNYSVKQWAKVCDKVNLWISTSNAEVSAMGIDYAMIRPIPIPDSIEVESMRGEKFITDFDTFFKFNTSPSSGVAISAAERMKPLSYYYSYDANVPSYVRIANCLEQIIQSDYSANYHFTLKQHIEFEWREMKNFIISYIMEKYQNKPYRTLIDKLPLKRVIKNNIIRSMDISVKARQTEVEVLQYMKKVSAMAETDQ